MHETSPNLHDLSPPNENGDGDRNDDDNFGLSLHLPQPLPPPLPTPSPSNENGDGDSDDNLNLFLHLPQPLPPPLPTLNPTMNLVPLTSSRNQNPNPSSPTSRSRSPSPTANPVAPTRFRRQLLRPGKTETIPAPYPWAKNRRAIIHSMRNLVRDGILKIVGKMKCKKCEKESEIEYDLVEKFREVKNFMVENKSEMYNRAPEVWNTPKRLDCESCGGERCVGAVIGKKRDINWLFLFLGQMVGFCSLEQLKYFCKHTRNHQTGARNRLLYIAYFSLCNQLIPHGQYHI